MLWDYSVIPSAQHLLRSRRNLGFKAAVTFSVLDIAVKLATKGAVDALMREVALVAFWVPAMPSFFLSQ